MDDDFWPDNFDDESKQSLIMLAENDNVNVMIEYMKNKSLLQVVNAVDFSKKLMNRYKKPTSYAQNKKQLQTFMIIFLHWLTFVEVLHHDRVVIKVLIDDAYHLVNVFFFLN